ncbi:NYN domain-containing protein, partial [Roseateles sp.]|nr:NYN domain-containing protein [Roseateles sp.]
MTTSAKKVAFLVDFDNVATDVIEQALNAVFKDYGAAHIRRAYCNAEQAQHQQAFLKRLGLRAIVNLAIGKNSTDIALAVDAMDLAITERPDVIVLVSSDSDFAPLVLRLREKGAWLRGFGQYGKTGEGVIQIYDQFNELAHGVGRAARDAGSAR